MENKKYSEQNDAYYDEQTNEWLEEVCDDPDCDLCVGRNKISLEQLEEYITNFLQLASLLPGLEFKITASASEFVGYKPDQIAPFFLKYPKNVKLPMEFLDVIYAPLRKT